MENGATHTNRLIRTLSRRQWLVSLLVVMLALGSLLLGWQGITNAEQSSGMTNLAGRQRMLSQRMALYLVLQQREADPQTRRHYRNLAATATIEFERAHERLAATAQKLGAESPIHSLYFGPDGKVDAESRRLLALARSAIDAATLGKATDSPNGPLPVIAAGNGLIEQLDKVTALYQQGDEEKEASVLSLQQASTLLIVVLVGFGLFGVFRPVIRRLTADMTSRDQAQHDLLESQERFKAFSECSSDWFWQTDTEHRFSWMQDSSQVQTPVPHERALGKSRLELRAEVEKYEEEKWHNFMAGLDAHQPFRDFEYRIGDDERSLRWVSVNGQPYFDERGNFLGYRGTARYIQERKDIEASHLRLLLAIEQSPVSIVITDAQARIIYVNAHFSAVSGYSADEALGRTPKLLWPDEAAANTFASLRAELALGNSWRGEVCNRNKNGNLYWESQSISPVRDHAGILTHYISVSEDITVQKNIARREQSRQRILEALVNDTPLPESLTLMASMAEAELPASLCAMLKLTRTQDKLRGTLFGSRASLLPATFVQAIEALEVAQEVGAGTTALHEASPQGDHDIDRHPYWRAYRALADAAGLRTCWLRPILSSTGKALGALAIHYHGAHQHDDNDIHVTELVASLAAIGLERDEAEQALLVQQEETRRLLAEYETIISNALVGIVYLKHRRVVSCNRRLEEIFGYAPGELDGESSERFYDSRQAFDAIGKEAYRVVAEGRNFNTELTLKRKDGSLFRGALTGRAVDPAQPQEGSIWIYADITERYRAEQEVHKLLQAVEQSPVSIFITNREGLIEYVNPRFTKVTGYRSDEVLGCNPRILQSGETPHTVYRELWQTILAGKEWHGVVRNRRKSGELFWEEASISPIRNDRGETTHFVAVKEDITERKRIEDELDQHRTHLEDLVEQRTADLTAALEAAKAADRAKDAFLAHISHELRTPLNAVIGLSELARRASSDPRQQDCLDKITGAGKSLAAIINDLLDLSKISAGRMEFENTSFSLRALIQRSRSVMVHRATEKGLELIERIDAEVPDILLGDSLRIEQILLNLLSNAIKFTPAGRVELRIHLLSQQDSRVCLGIEVADTGIGLAEESIARLFQPFAQADASINRKYGGTGLGLVLCKRLAEMMDGDIAVTSREGLGTTFKVKLWLSLGQAAQLPETARAARQHALPARYHDAQVLVVDDQPLNREIVEALLEEVGIVTRRAGNGQEALDILSQAGPAAFDLVLMDIQMPVVDGLTATRVIRKLDGFGQLPIIAMTAHTMEHEKEISSAAGMNDHIGKPFETEHFFSVLARWIPVAKHQFATTAASASASPAATGLTVLHGVDTQGALARFGGNRERYRHWLMEFLGDAPDYAEQIRRWLADGDSEAAHQAAHAFKGRVGMLGMSGLQPLAAALDATLIQGAPTGELLDRLETAIERQCTQIRAALGAIKAPPPSSSAPGPQPTGPLPEAIAQVIVMLQRGDGDSAGAIQRCLAELKDTAWAARLEQAHALARNFDFDAACELLAAGHPDAARRIDA